MMLKRKAMQELVDWKAHRSGHALLVTGARQVGKTHLIRQFAHEQYASFAEINLIEQPLAREAFERATNAEALFLRMTAFAETELVPHETLIFIDEIQECNFDIVTALKFLIDRYGNEYDFVFSGSLLGVELQNVRSLPVGYLSIVEMYPLDLEEFFWARGVGSYAIDEARRAFLEMTPVDEFVDLRLREVFHQYLLVGGMPDAVSAFVDEGNLQRVMAVQADILNLYRRDISKYAGGQARTVRRIFDLVPSELATQSKRFTLSHIEGNSRFDRYDNGITWLVDAGVSLMVRNVAEPRYPLELSADASFFKLFMNDVGLLSCACGVSVVREMLSGRSDVNYGSIYENFVAQELAAHGLASSAPDPHLYFFRNRRVGELDFLVEWPRARVLPIEVKSGKTYKRHSALSTALATENWGIERAVVLCEGNVEVAGPIAYLPPYMTMFITADA